MAILPQLFAAVAKEMRIIFRDPEALGILFVLPAIFVLIMSLAMQDAFDEQAGVKFSVLLLDADGGTIGDAVVDSFTASGRFKLETHRAADGALPEWATVEAQVRSGQYQFAVRVPAEASAKAEQRARETLQPGTDAKESAQIVTLLADPALRADHRLVVVNALNLALQQAESGLLLQTVGLRLTTLSGGRAAVPTEIIRLVEPVRDPYEKAEQHRITPTSVQQNAPAWALLAMFFLVVPLGGTVVRERQEGSLMRLRTMSAPLGLILVGKIVPYFLINQVQIVLILLEGVYLLPLLGGQRLEIGNAPEAILLLNACVSIAAIGYGLMIASFCRTAEQANIFGATSILILAALGGVMVPKLVMPAFLQEMTVVSPLGWGLEGYLQLFVRGGGSADILSACAALLAFGGACLLVGVLRFPGRA